MTTYKVVRFYRNEDHPDNGMVVATGLSLEEAQEHCSDESTHGHDVNGDVEWFDGYNEEQS